MTLIVLVILVKLSYISQAFTAYILDLFTGKRSAQGENQPRNNIKNHIVKAALKKEIIIEET